MDITGTVLRLCASTFRQPTQRISAKPDRADHGQHDHAGAHDARHPDSLQPHYERIQGVRKEYPEQQGDQKRLRPVQCENQRNGRQDAERSAVRIDWRLKRERGIASAVLSGVTTVSTADSETGFPVGSAGIEVEIMGRRQLTGYRTVAAKGRLALGASKNKERTTNKYGPSRL